MKYWQWSSDKSCVRMTRCISVSMSSYVVSEHLSTRQYGVSNNAYLDEIDFCEGLIAAGFLDIEDGYDVLVVEISQQLHLTQCSKAEHRVVERRNLLDSDFLARGLV